MGNWAIQHMDDWKIHHTTEMNWVRNEDVRHDGWQYSDNARGWIIKSTTPSAGIRKTFNNALFVGMSKVVYSTGLVQSILAGNRYDLFFNRFFHSEYGT